MDRKPLHHIDADTSRLNTQEHDMDTRQQSALERYRDAIADAHATYGPYIADFPQSVRDSLSVLRSGASREQGDRFAFPPVSASGR
jgi:hypothetical protein